MLVAFERTMVLVVGRRRSAFDVVFFFFFFTFFVTLASIAWVGVHGLEGGAWDGGRVADPAQLGFEAGGVQVGGRGRGLGTDVCADLGRETTDHTGCGRRRLHQRSRHS